jgi:D-sedoheptulose 7-phosphate isomerase
MDARFDCRFRIGDRTTEISASGNRRPVQKNYRSASGRSDRRALPAICLAADTTALTCIANDWDFASVFARQIEAYCKPGDVLMVFSSSGNSENLVRACQTMKNYGGTALALLGRGGGRVQQIADLSLVVNSNRTASIQEAHEVILHLILEYVERTVD